MIRLRSVLLMGFSADAEGKNCIKTMLTKEWQFNQKICTLCI
jgi:hypothetical protein